MSNESPQPDVNFDRSIADLKAQVVTYTQYCELYPESKDKIDAVIAKLQETIKYIEALPPPKPKGGKRRSKRAHSKRRVHRKSHRKSHRRH